MSRFGCYIGKRRQEELVLRGPVPATVLRGSMTFAQWLDSADAAYSPAGNERPGSSGPVLS
jgi:hypothetical protein